MKKRTRNQSPSFFYGGRRQKVLEVAAQHPMIKGGELELDSDARVSEGDDNGAYVQTWMWVPFEGTSLDKNV